MAKSKPSRTISLRAPIELVEWLEKFAEERPDRPALTLSQAAVWLMQQGREYLTIVNPDQLEAVGRAKGIPRQGVLMQALEKGLPLVEDYQTIMRVAEPEPDYRPERRPGKKSRT